MSPRTLTAAFALAAAALAAGPAAAQPRLTVRVAALVPADGSFVVHNRLLARGAEVAATESSSGVKVSLTQVRVRRGDSAAAVVARAVRAGARAVVLPCNDDRTPALADAASAAHLLALSPCTPDAGMIRRGTFRWAVAMTGRAEAAQLVDYARRQNATSAFVIGVDGSWYSSRLTPLFVRAIKAEKLRLVGHADVQPRALPIAALAKKIKASGARAVFTPLFSPYVEQLTAGLRRHGVIAPIYAGDGTDADLRLSRYGGALSPVKDLLFASYGFARPEADPFQRAYKRRFGRYPDGSFPGLGFQTIALVRLAASRARSSEPAAMDAALARGLRVTGVALGDTTYARNGSGIPTANVGVAEAIRGEYVPLFSSPAPPLRLG